MAKCEVTLSDSDSDAQVTPPTPYVTTIKLYTASLRSATILWSWGCSCHYSRGAIKMCSCYIQYSGGWTVVLQYSNGTARVTSLCKLSIRVSLTHSNLRMPLQTEFGVVELHQSLASLNLILTEFGVGELYQTLHPSEFGPFNSYGGWDIGRSSMGVNS